MSFLSAWKAREIRALAPPEYTHGDPRQGDGGGLVVNSAALNPPRPDLRISGQQEYLNTMKTPLIFALVATALLLPATTQAAKGKDKVPDDRPKLGIIISESVGFRTPSIDDFIRLDIAFSRVAKERKWPVQIAMERFAANVPEYENEVTIFTQPIRQELPGEYTLRGWTTLTIAGKKHDFGIVKFDYRPRLGEWTDSWLEKFFLGFANAVADKIEPVLFPKDETAPAPEAAPTP